MVSAALGTFAMTESGLLNLDNLFCALVLFLIAEVGGFAWSAMKSVVGMQ